MKISYTTHTTNTEAQASTAGLLDAKITLANGLGQVCFYKTGFPRGMNEGQVKQAVTAWLQDLLQAANVEGDAFTVTDNTEQVQEQCVRDWAAKHPEVRFYVWSAFLENGMNTGTFDEALVKARLRLATHENDRGARIVVAGGTHPTVYMRRPFSAVEEWSTRELPTDDTPLRIDGPLA